MKTPLVCTFPGITPSDKTQYKLYKRKGINDDQIFVHGENDRIEYDGDTKDADSDFKYVVAIFNKKKKKVYLREAPLVNMTQSVKAIKAAVEAENLDKRVSAVDKRGLGQAFGTRKAQAAIRSYDRGKIEVANMADTSSHIAGLIVEKAAAMQSQEEIQDISDKSRLIPPFDAATTSVDLIYKLEDVISPKEMASIEVDVLLDYKEPELEDLKQKKTYCTYVLGHIRGAIAGKDRKKLAMLIYLDYLMKFKDLKPAVLNRKGEFYNLMGSIPKPIEATLFQNFAEGKPGVKEGSIKYSIPSAKKTLIVAYICALALHIDHFSVDPVTLAHDLHLTPTKVSDRFKSLGCQVDYKSKLCRLVAPLQFPKPSRGRRG